MQTSKQQLVSEDWKKMASFGESKVTLDVINAAAQDIQNWMG
jgi:hypothetical protein